VTHDQAEALVLADRMAVLRDGQLQQIGAPAEVFNKPANEFVANFVGVETVLPGQIVGVSDGAVSVAVGGKILNAVEYGGSGTAGQVLACIRPEDVALSRPASVGPTVPNQFAARVVAVTSDGALFKVTLDAGFSLVAYVAKQSYLELELAPGASVVASVKATAIHLIAR
jgi:molybdopterin-binding protein